MHWVAMCSTGVKITTPARTQSSAWRPSDSGESYGSTTTPAAAMILSSSSFTLAATCPPSGTGSRRTASVPNGKLTFLNAPDRSLLTYTVPLGLSKASCAITPTVGYGCNLSIDTLWLQQQLMSSNPQVVSCAQRSSALAARNY